MVSHQRVSLSLSTSFTSVLVHISINGEIFKFIALAALEILKTQSVAVEVSLSVMYVSREATFAFGTSLSFSKNE